MKTDLIKHTQGRLRRAMLRMMASCRVQLAKIQEHQNHPLPPIEQPPVVEPIAEPVVYSASIEYPSHRPRVARRKRPMSGEPKDIPGWQRGLNAGLLIAVGKPFESSYRFLKLYALLVVEKAERWIGGER